MIEQASSGHPQRLKMDGSSDLICLNCLGTITASDKANQIEADSHHICHPSFSASRSSALERPQDRF
jgi:hypothetical protein